MKRIAGNYPSRSLRSGRAVPPNASGQANKLLAATTKHLRANVSLATTSTNRWEEIGTTWQQEKDDCCFCWWGAAIGLLPVDLEKPRKKEVKRKKTIKCQRRKWLVLDAFIFSATGSHSLGSREESASSSPPRVGCEEWIDQLFHRIKQNNFVRFIYWMY